jgi:hypothetical protein
MRRTCVASAADGASVRRRRFAATSRPGYQILGLLLGGIMLAAGCNDGRTYHLALQSGESLDQAAAIRLSREALRQAGHDPNAFELFPIREGAPPDGRYFGTGPALPPHGYVLWKKKEPRLGRRGLTVSIELRDRVALCKLSWWH